MESDDGSRSEEEDDDDDYEEDEGKEDRVHGEGLEEEEDELDEDDMEVDPPAVRSPQVFVSFSHFFFKGSRTRNSRRARKPSGRAAAMKKAAAEEVPSRTPGPPKGRKRKLSSPQAHSGPKRNRKLRPRSQTAAEDISDGEPIEGLAEGLASLGYPGDFQIAVSLSVLTYFLTHKIHSL